MQRFTRLAIWKREHALALKIYDVTRSFPRKEIFGMTSQLRRAAVSVPCNIAEGAKRRHRLDYAKFLNIAEASLAEVETLLLLAGDVGYLNQQRAKPLLAEAQEISRMICVFRQKVELADRSPRTVNC